MSNKRRNMACRRIGDSMIVLRENEDTPADEDWDAFLAMLVHDRDRFPKLKILVMTEGGGPSAEQRKRLKVALDGRPVRVACVTDSVKVRFIASSVALLNRQIRTFSKSELDGAYTHLGMNSAEQKIAAAVLDEIEKQVDF